MQLVESQTFSVPSHTSSFPTKLPMASHRKKRDFVPKKHIAQQLLDLETAGIELAYEQEVPLSSSNVQVLKSSRAKIFGILIPTVALILFITYSLRSEEIVLVVGLGLSLAVTSILLKTFLKIRAALITGTKTMVRGIITDRFTRTDYSVERDDDGKRRARKNLYLVIGNREFVVNHEIYSAYRIGDALELYFIESTKKSKAYFLEHHLLKGAGIR